jgi:hypothetical protein
MAQAVANDAGGEDQGSNRIAPLRCACLGQHL